MIEQLAYYAQSETKDANVRYALLVKIYSIFDHITNHSYKCKIPEKRTYFTVHLE